MITAFNLVYSASAVRRMLGSKFPVVRIEKWWKVCLVIFQGCRPRFMSKAAFLKHFVEWRKAQARALQVTKNLFISGAYTVRNPEKNSSYKVQAFGGGLICECEDYSNQSKFFGKACCKHGYALIHHLGFEYLSDYISAHGSSGYLRM
jgi:hypothetical protein